MIIGYDFQNFLNYDYRTEYSCDTSGCNEEGICRCGTIVDATINSVNVTEISREILNIYFDNTKSSKRNFKINTILSGISQDIELYTIDRILRINNIYQDSVWSFQFCNGYYGQELDNIILDTVLSQKIESQLDKALSILDLSKRIEYLLQLEYGEVLPELKDCKYELCEIERDSVIFGSESQLSRVAKENLSHYNDSNYNSIRGIVIPKNDKYRLIDGYHRCFASENRFIKVLKICK